MQRSIALAATVMLSFLAVGPYAHAELVVHTVRGDGRVDGASVSPGMRIGGGLVSVAAGAELILIVDENLVMRVGADSLVIVEPDGGYGMMRLLHGSVTLVGEIDRWRVTIAPFSLAVTGEAVELERSAWGDTGLTIGRGEVAIRDHRPTGIGTRVLAARNGARWEASARAGGLTTFSLYEPSSVDLERFSVLGRIIGLDLAWSSWDRGIVDRPASSSER